MQIRRNFKICKLALTLKENYLDQFKGGYLEDNSYFVVSTLRKKSLKHKLFKNNQPEKNLKLLYHAACALERLHYHGFTHRNISPLSFWTTYDDGQPIILCDFQYALNNKIESV